MSGWTFLKRRGQAVDPESTHIFNEGGTTLIFRKEDMSLVALRSPSREAQREESYSPCSKNLTDYLLSQIAGADSHCEFEPLGVDTVRRSERPALDRLTVAISNACNLGCSYCYASAGTYYNVDGLMMSRETAMNALSRAAATYSRIEHINFFGGEPTLNGDIIEVVCEYARYLHQRGVLSHMPSFGITTNGYSLSDRILEIFTGYNFTVTLGLDGPKELHDLNRPTKTGKGSYDAVAFNAKRLLECGLTVEFECTYTADHLKYGFEIADLMDFFHNEFGCRTLHCPVVSVAPENPQFIPFDRCLHLVGDAIEYSILNLARGVPNTLSTAMRMLHSLTGKIPMWHYCPAGRTEITVNADGNIFACFMLMQQDGYSFGNVNGGVTSSELSFKILDRWRAPGSKKDVIEDLIDGADKYKNLACLSCWAQPLCHGCLGEDFERHHGCIVRSSVTGVSQFCDYKRGVVDRFLRSIARAYALSQKTATSSCA